MSIRFHAAVGAKFPAVAVKRKSALIPGAASRDRVESQWPRGLSGFHHQPRPKPDNSLSNPN
jgi:hypothetical protein